MKTALIMPLLFVSLGFTQDRPRVYVTDKQMDQASLLATRSAAVANIQRGDDPRTTEIQADIVKVCPHVTVTNQIEILPASPNDDRIRRQVARAIFNDERLFRYSMGSVPPIHIIVKNGHVTLEGVVNSQSDKDAANIRANGVPGVFSVENHLQVQKS